MKKQKLKGTEVKYFTPEFDTFKAKSLVSVRKHPSFPGIEFPADKIEQEREITTCQVVIPLNNVYIISTGIAVMNPKDVEETDLYLGEIIAEGRAVKNNIKCLEVVTAFKPTTAVKEVVRELAKVHVQRNLNTYITQMREALKM